MSAKTKCFLCLSLFVSIFASCSKNETPTNEANIQSKKVGLTSNDTISTIFSPINISLTGPTGTLSEINQSFDSIVTYALPGDTAISILKNESGNTSTFSWTTNFYYPGKYTVYLDGYKDGKVISKDSIHFQINATQKFDFIRFNWADLQTTTFDEFVNTYSRNNFYFGKATENNISYVYVLSTLQEGFGENLKSDSRLNNLYQLLEKNYGKPQYVDSIDHKNLLEKYQEIFLVKRTGKTPIYIWQSEKSNIAILEDANMYSIHAEQRK